MQLRFERVSKHAQRPGRVARLLGLTELLDRKRSQLSGGQQQRVARAGEVS